MSNELTIPAGFGPLAPIFTGKPLVDDLGAGVTGGFPVVGYRGKVWSIKYQGNEYPLMREDGDGARGSIEVVIVRAATVISKIFYENGYVDGSTSAPDCFSNNGQTPDPGAHKKQSPTCAACPQNAWGSRITEAGKQGKNCADSKRVVVLPAGDLGNERFGGPMLLRVPAASLKALKAYGELLQSYGYPYFAVATRISFDPKEAFPSFVFQALRPLSQEEGEYIVAMRDDPSVTRILSEQEVTGQVNQPAAAAAVPASPFIQAPDTVAAPAPVPQHPAPAQAPAGNVVQHPAVAPKPAVPKAPPKPRATPKPVAPTAAPAAPAPAATVATPPAPKPRPPAPTAPAAAVATEAPAPVLQVGEGVATVVDGDATAPTGNDEFDAMLDNLLK